MKKGINIWSFRGDASIAECIQLAKEAGFEGIELSLNKDGELGLQAGDQVVKNIKAQLEDANLEIAGLATGLYWDYPMTSDDPAVREKAIDICKNSSSWPQPLEWMRSWLFLGRLAWISSPAPP